MTLLTSSILGPVAVARVFRRGDFPRDWQQPLAPEEASYNNPDRNLEMSTEPPFIDPFRLPAIQSHPDR